MKHEKLSAKFPVLQADAERFSVAAEQFIAHAISIRDNSNYFRVDAEQARQIASRLRHAAEIVDQFIEGDR